MRSPVLFVIAVVNLGPAVPRAESPAPGRAAPFGLSILVIGASQFAHEDDLIRDRHPDLAVVGIADSPAGCRHRNCRWTG